MLNYYENINNKFISYSCNIINYSNCYVHKETEEVRDEYQRSKIKNWINTKGNV